MRGARVARIVGWVFLGVVLAAVLGLVLGLVVMWLWNWLMPALFGLPEITYLQAVGVFVLCHLLFKGHHGGHDRDRGEDDRRAGHRFARRVKERIRRDVGPVEPAPEAPLADGGAPAP